MTAIESVAQTLKQIEQYQTQLQQYENMLQNTMAPAAYIWDQAQSTINGLMNAVNTLDYYRNQLGSLDSYLGKFRTWPITVARRASRPPGARMPSASRWSRTATWRARARRRRTTHFSRVWSNSSAT